jgi:Tfp pilus assembly protein PilV
MKLRGVALHRHDQRGMTIVELMIACVVLMVGMLGIAVLFSTAATATSHTKLDTGGTMVAKMVMEQLSAQDPNSTAVVQLTDCNNTTWNMTTTPGASPSGAGAPLDATASSITYGGIDFTQAAVSGYSMNYQDCGNSANGQATTYDVRWNVMTVSAIGGITYTRMITVAARQKGNSNRGSYFAIPVTLRTVAGPTQQ